LELRLESKHNLRVGLKGLVELVECSSSWIIL